MRTTRLPTVPVLVAAASCQYCWVGGRYLGVGQVYLSTLGYLPPVIPAPLYTYPPGYLFLGYLPPGYLIPWDTYPPDTYPWKEPGTRHTYPLPQKGPGTRDTDPTVNRHTPVAGSNYDMMRIGYHWAENPAHTGLFLIGYGGGTTQIWYMIVELLMGLTKWINPIQNGLEQSPDILCSDGVDLKWNRVPSTVTGKWKMDHYYHIIMNKICTRSLKLYVSFLNVLLKLYHQKTSSHMQNIKTSFQLCRIVWNNSV